MNGATDIDALPLFHRSTEVDNGQTAQSNNTQQMTQQQMNQFVSGIQKASASGSIALPSRDIPQSQSHITHDQQIKPNYIEPVDVRQNTTDYISNDVSTEEVIKYQDRKEDTINKLNDLYENLHTPVLLAILFFLFQLPVVRNKIFTFAPSLFNRDGNPNITGYIINSVLFALLYYVISSVEKYLASR